MLIILTNGIIAMFKILLFQLHYIKCIKPYCLEYIIYTLEYSHSQLTNNSQVCYGNSVICELIIIPYDTIQTHSNH